MPVKTNSSLSSVHVLFICEFAFELDRTSWRNLNTNAPWWTHQCMPSCLITCIFIMTVQSHCYLRQSFLIEPQQTSVTTWHQSARPIWRCAGSDQGLLLFLSHWSILTNSKKIIHFLFNCLGVKNDCYANTGSLGQLNLCLCEPNHYTGIVRSDIIDADNNAGIWLYLCWGHFFPDKNVFPSLIYVFDC